MYRIGGLIWGFGSGALVGSGRVGFYGGDGTLVLSCLARSGNGKDDCKVWENPLVVSPELVEPSNHRTICGFSLPSFDKLRTNGWRICEILQSSCGNGWCSQRSLVVPRQCVIPAPFDRFRGRHPARPKARRRHRLATALDSRFCGNDGQAIRSSFQCCCNTRALCSSGGLWTGLGRCRLRWTPCRIAGLLRGSSGRSRGSRRSRRPGRC